MIHMMHMALSGFGTSREGGLLKLMKDEIEQDHNEACWAVNNANYIHVV